MQESAACMITAETYETLRFDGVRHGVTIEEGEIARASICLDRLFRVFVGGYGKRTVFLEATSEEAALLKAIQLVSAIESRRRDSLDAYNGTSAKALMQRGVSLEPLDRLFEVSVSGDRVTAWVSDPLFLVPKSDLLIRVWNRLMDRFG